MGRPPKSPASELEEKVDAYFASCGEREEYPTEAGMILWLGMSVEKYSQTCDDKDYGPVMERARLKRKAWLENRMVTEPKCANGCMNALRQEENGGYRDKSAQDVKKRELVIRLDGVGKGAAM